MELSNTTPCLVTGASSGIGRALALQLAERGAPVALIARRGEKLRELAEEIGSRGGRALPIQCDVAIHEEFEEAVARTIDEYGRLDVLVNNAGRGHFAYIEETPDEQIESIFRVNVFSLWYGTAPAIRQMRQQGSGHIINISSIAGKIGYPANAAYVAAKHATIGFTRALRAELAGSGIEASVVVPAGVATNWAMVTEGGAMLGIFDYEGRRGAEIAMERGIEPIASPELLSPEQIAAAIIDLIRHPVPELYTHPGSREIVRAFEEDQLAIEKRMEPFWLANQEGYRKEK